MRIGGILNDQCGCDLWHHCDRSPVSGTARYSDSRSCGDEYLGKHPKFGAWRDTHVKIFCSDLQILSALKLAALRGVDVRILLPEKADHRTVYLASFSYYLDRF